MVSVGITVCIVGLSLLPNIPRKTEHAQRARPQAQRAYAPRSRLRLHPCAIAPLAVGGPDEQALGHEIGIAAGDDLDNSGPCRDGSAPNKPQKARSFFDMYSEDELANVLHVHQAFFSEAHAEDVSVLPSRQSLHDLVLGKIADIDAQDGSDTP